MAAAVCEGATVYIAEGDKEPVVALMAEWLLARPDLLAKRRERVEHPFGSIKQWMSQGVP